jgi:hypothetical protein
MNSSLQRALAPVLILAVLSMGCGTSYAPREPGRINFVLTTGGEEALEKDGKRYKIGGFSGDLSEAVKGNPAAEEHARAYVRRERIATGLAILGGGALGIGYLSFALLVGPYDSTAEGGGPGPEARRTLMITMTSGLVVWAVSLIGAGINYYAAEGHLLDAVNVYNDDAAKGAPR